MKMAISCLLYGCTIKVESDHSYVAGLTLTIYVNRGTLKIVFSAVSSFIKELEKA